jgi:hypothetical protein
LPPRWASWAGIPRSLRISNNTWSGSDSRCILPYGEGGSWRQMASQPSGLERRRHRPKITARGARRRGTEPGYARHARSNECDARPPT